MGGKMWRDTDNVVVAVEDLIVADKHLKVALIVASCTFVNNHIQTNVEWLTQ